MKRSIVICLLAVSAIAWTGCTEYTQDVGCVKDKTECDIDNNVCYICVDGKYWEKKVCEYGIKMENNEFIGCHENPNSNSCKYGFENGKCICNNLCINKEECNPDGSCLCSDECAYGCNPDGSCKETITCAEGLKADDKTGKCECYENCPNNCNPDGSCLCSDECAYGCNPDGSCKETITCAEELKINDSTGKCECHTSCPNDCNLDGSCHCSNKCINKCNPDGSCINLENCLFGNDEDTGACKCKVTCPDNCNPDGSCPIVDSNDNHLKDEFEPNSEIVGKSCRKDEDCSALDNGFCDSFMGYKCSVRCMEDKQCVEGFVCRNDGDGRCASEYFTTVWSSDLRKRLYDDSSNKIKMIIPFEKLESVNRSRNCSCYAWLISPTASEIALPRLVLLLCRIGK